MIIRAPLSKCPNCHYLLRGLPTAGRCPECGFHYDEHTIVMRPAKVWRKFLVTVGIEILLLYQLSPILFVLLGKVLPGQYAFATLLALVLGVFAATALYLFRVTKHDHFAALTPKGVVVKNRSGEHWVAVEDISLFSKYDPTPMDQEERDRPHDLPRQSLRRQERTGGVQASDLWDRRRESITQTS